MARTPSRTALGDQLAFSMTAIGNALHRTQVMGDEEIGIAVIALEAVEQLEDFFRCQRIEG